MTKRTGNHSGRRLAAKAEPSPITALRDMLAAAFAADISAVTPEVCETLRTRITMEASPAKRDQVRNALVVLARHSADLALAVGHEMRNRFDTKLTAGVGPHTRTAQLSLGDVAVMNDARLKLDLALDACANRLREQTAAEVTKLTARVCELVGREKLEDSENPIVPRAFARALLESLSKLGFDDETRLEVFKAYGPALLHIAPDLYFNANTLLVERGTSTVARPEAILDRLLSGQH